MKRKVIFFGISIAGFIVCYPLLFIFTGSLMSGGELCHNLGGLLMPQVEDYAEWSMVPQFWSLEAYKDLFLYEPGFFVLFWNTVKICLGVLIGHALFAVPCAWGFAMYDFRFKKTLLQYTSYL